MLWSYAGFALTTDVSCRNAPSNPSIFESVGAGQRDDCGRRDDTVEEWFKVLDDALAGAQKRHRLVETVVEAAKACCVLR